MTRPVQIEVRISGRWYGWTVVASEAEARVEVERARRQGLEARIEREGETA